MASATIKRRGARRFSKGPGPHTVMVRAMVCRPVTIGWEADNVPELAGFGSWIKKGAKGVVGGAKAVGGVAVKGVKAGAGLQKKAWKWQYNQAKLGGKFILERKAGLPPGSIDAEIARANASGKPPAPEFRAMLVQAPAEPSWWDKLLEAFGLA